MALQGAIGMMVATAQPPAGLAQSWRLHRLRGAPHRLGFAVGAVLLCLSALWWLALLLAAHLGAPLGWAVAPPLAHGLVFTLGFMPAFMAGFLFTAGPRWLGLPAVAAPALLSPLLQLGAGWLMVLTGLQAGAALVAVGMATAAAGWLRLTLRFAALLRSSRVPDRLHAHGLLAGCAVGVVAMLLACWALLAGEAGLLRVAIHVGLWGFVGPVFAVASHRMLPFFDAAAWPPLDAAHPHAPLWITLAGLALMGLAELAWLPPELLAGPLALAALVQLGVALRWARQHGLRGESRRLLAMLHGGFVWLGLALALQAASLLLQARGHGGLGAAPLHALTLGWLGSTLMAMVTRVAAGHSGRPLAIDRLAWAVYGLLQLAVLLRIAAGLGWVGPAGQLAAAALWAAVSAAWAGRCVGWLGRPRVDGRPG